MRTAAILMALLMAGLIGCGKDNPAGSGKPPRVNVYNLLPDPITSVTVGTAKWTSIPKYSMSDYQPTSEGYPMMRLTYRGDALSISLRDAGQYPFETGNSYQIKVRYNYYSEYAYIAVSHQGPY